MMRVSSRRAKVGAAGLLLSSTLWWAGEVAGVVFAGEGAAQRFSVTVHQPEERPLPVAFNVPVGEGEWREGEGVGVYQGGEALAVQTGVVSRWADGSPRWLQLLSPVEAGEVEVRLGGSSSSAEVAEPVEVQREGDVFELRSGAVRFSVNADAMVGELANGDRVVRLPLSRVRSEDGRLFEARQGRVSVIEEGPVRSTLRLEGYHRHGDEGFIRLDVFLSLYAGEPVLEVNHVIGVNHEDMEVGQAREMMRLKSLSVPLEFGDSGAEGEARVSLAESESWQALPAGHSLFQWENFAFELLSEEGGVVDRGGRLGGSLVLKAGDVHVAVAVPDFWEQNPKGFTLEGDRLSIDLYPRLDRPEGGRYADRENEHIWYYYLRDDVYEMRQGVEKSHRFFVGLYREDEAGELEALTRSLQVMPVGIPQLEQVNASGALPGELVAPHGEFAEWDRMLEAGMDDYYDSAMKAQVPLRGWPRIGGRDQPRRPGYGCRSDPIVAAGDGCVR